MKHKRDDGAEKQDEETVDVTPIMICVFVVMCCSMLVLLYYFYDRLGTTQLHTHHCHKSILDIIKEKKQLFGHIHFCVFPVFIAVLGLFALKISV